jgi:hypothetical protein
MAYLVVQFVAIVVFLLVVAPLGLLWRALGYDPLARRRASSSGWSPYPGRHRQRNHYLNRY